jgi:hypothetical protein
VKEILHKNKHVRKNTTCVSDVPYKNEVVLVEKTSPTRGASPPLGKIFNCLLKRGNQWVKFILKL